MILCSTLQTVDERYIIQHVQNEVSFNTNIELSQPNCRSLRTNVSQPRQSIPTDVPAVHRFSNRKIGKLKINFRHVQRHPIFE